MLLDHTGRNAEMWGGMNFEPILGREMLFGAGRTAGPKCASKRSAHLPNGSERMISQGSLRLWDYVGPYPSEYSSTPAVEGGFGRFGRRKYQLMRDGTRRVMKMRPYGRRTAPQTVS